MEHERVINRLGMVLTRAWMLLYRRSLPFIDLKNLYMDFMCRLGIVLACMWAIEWQWRIEDAKTQLNSVTQSVATSIRYTGCT